MCVCVAVLCQYMCFFFFSLYICLGSHSLFFFCLCESGATHASHFSKVDKGEWEEEVEDFGLCRVTGSFSDWFHFGSHWKAAASKRKIGWDTVQWPSAATWIKQQKRRGLGRQKAIF